METGNRHVGRREKARLWRAYTIYNVVSDTTSGQCWEILCPQPTPDRGDYPGWRGARSWSTVVAHLLSEHTVNPQPEQIEGKSAEDQNRTVILVSRPLGFFGKAVALVTALFLFALAFVFSLIVLAVLVAVVLVFLAYVWWARRHTRSSVRVTRRK